MNRGSFAVYHRRSSGVAFILAALLTTACGSGEIRGLGGPLPKIGIQNPVSPDASNSLQLSFATAIDDQGNKTHGVDLKMQDLNPETGLKWSLSNLLGPRFKVKIVDTVVSMKVQTEGPSEGYYVPENPIPSLTSAQFDAFLSTITATKYLRILSQDNVALSADVAIPLRLADYASTNFAPLAQRNLSNCDTNNLPSLVEWAGSSSKLMRFYFYSNEMQLLRSFADIQDLGEWMLTPTVFEGYFTPEERAALETPDPIFGYSYGIKVGTMSFARSLLHSVSLPTNPPQVMKIHVEGVETADYRFEYQGGCGL